MADCTQRKERRVRKNTEAEKNHCIKTYPSPWLLLSPNDPHDAQQPLWEHQPSGKARHGIQPQIYLLVLDFKVGHSTGERRGYVRAPARSSISSQLWCVPQAEICNDIGEFCSPALIFSVMRCQWWVALAVRGFHSCRPSVLYIR